MTQEAVSVRLVAEVLGISERRVQQLVALGAIHRPERGLYDLQGAIRSYAAYLIDHGRRSSGNPHRARLIAAKADLAQLELERLQSETVSVAAVQQVWSEIRAAIKERVRAIPATVAPLLAGEGNPETCQQIMRDVIDQALTELAESPVSEPIN